MKILVVDDHKNTCITLSAILKRDAHEVQTAGSGAEALQRINGDRYDLVITDLKLGDMDGIDIVSAVKAQSPPTEVVVITAFGSISSAVRAMKIGAYDYLTKPLRRDEILGLVSGVGAKRDLPRRAPRVLSTDTPPIPTIIGKTSAILEVARLIREIAPVDVPVLITGESGTGKELVARSIHALSGRRSKPFIAINCGALPEHLQESELFGYVKGAFTGAMETKRGLFEEAGGGTVLLDEIAETAISTQVKLLRVLQDGEVRPVGSTCPLHIDARVLASSNQPLETLVEQNRFRRDLFFRVNVVRIALPALRNRLDDLPLLAEHFIKKFSARFEKSVLGISDEALRLLRQHPWTGNVRELENCLKRAVILCGSSTIGISDIESLVVPKPEYLPGHRLVEQERDLIFKTLTRLDWNQKKAAAELGIGVTTLWRKIKKYGLSKVPQSM